MPLRELYMTFQGKSSKKKWKPVIRQMSLAVGVIFGFFLTGLMLRPMIIPQAKLHSLASKTSPNVFFIKPFSISITVLLSVIVIIEIFGFLAYRRPAPKSK